MQLFQFGKKAFRFLDAAIQRFALAASPRMATTSSKMQHGDVVCAAWSQGKQGSVCLLSVMPFPVVQKRMQQTPFRFGLPITALEQMAAATGIHKVVGGIVSAMFGRLKMRNRKP